jgi:DNA (cytosine-5)-methyltransferase 1
VLADLEAEGYQARPFDIPACALGADHERRRIWVVAYADRQRLQGRGPERAGQRTEALPEATLWGNLPAPYVCGGADGIPDRAHRLHALGNAVVPQIPEIIGRAILEAEAMTRSDEPQGEA